MPFWQLCRKSKAILSKKFHPGYRDLSNQFSPASHMNTSKFFMKERVTRRDLEN